MARLSQRIKRQCELNLRCSVSSLLVIVLLLAVDAADGLLLLFF